ncbi:lysylphosphatidylglycerol synthase transmembrane domain-containing protein [soil metagenome]
MSTGPSLEATQRRWLLRIAGWALAAYVVAKVGVSLVHGLADIRTHPLESPPNWGVIALSGLVFLVAHAVLVETWRSVLGCWDEHLPFWSAARVWSVSNLGRYVPGKVWQIGIMGTMARQLQVSPIAASGSALLGTLVNIVAGFAVALVSGRALLISQVPPQMRGLAIAAVAAAVSALLLMPFIIPRLAPILGRVLGRPLAATLPVRAIVYSLVGNTVAWLAYGAAFQLFVRGVLGSAAGAYPSYLAAYTSSYLIGYIFLFAPAGVGFREGAMLGILQLTGLATYSEASLVTLTSRLWLTLLEVTPAILFWAHYRMRRRSPTPDPSDVPT